MDKNNPEITQKLLAEIKNQKSEIVDIGEIKIKTCKNVFPPKSYFSRSSEKLYTIFGNLKGKKVLDVGTGTGIQAIQAIREGASYALGLDINSEAVQCAKENIELNGLSDKVKIIYSDLFSALDREDKFDVVIANLPITNYPIGGIIESALYDPGFQIHQRFFEEVGKHLNEKAAIIMTHINFNGPSDFPEFENFISAYGFKADQFIETSALNYVWRMYRLVQK